MQIKLNLRKAAELGIGLTAIATLVLAGCGGGGGGVSVPSVPVAATNTVKVTPGKGIMLGAMVTIKDANRTPMGSSPTDTTGVATVNIPVSALLPLIVEVQCTSVCSYWDERTMGMVSGVASAPLMDAVVPSLANLNIGVSAATNAAAQYALVKTGSLKVADVMAANQSVISSLGLPVGTNILTPPTIINNATTQATVLAATTGDANLLAKISAKLAMAASGVSALQVIGDYGTAWQNAAVTPASGVILPTSINPAIVSGVIPTTTIPNVASAVAATTTSAASAVADANTLITDITGGGIAQWWVNYSGSNASGVPASSAVQASVSTATANGGNSYTVTIMDKQLTGTTWGANPNPYVDYRWTAGVWTQNTNGGTLVNNGDGTLTITPTGYTARVQTLVRTNLAGSAITCFDSMMTTSAVPCVATGNYPPASALYASSGVLSVDEYRLNGGNSVLPVTNATGVALTALPAPGTSFCVNQGGALFFQAITGATGGADNYNVFGALSCSSADITNAQVNPTMGTVLGTLQAATATTPAVALVAVSVAQMASLGWLNDNFIAVRAGMVYPGQLNRQGSPSPMLQDLNKVAANAQLVANGYAPLP